MAILSRVPWSRVDKSVNIEQRRPERHAPLVSLFRWWARRPASLIGAIVEACSDEYGPNVLLSDPMSGGGTVAFESARRDVRFYAQELHPWAATGLAVAIRPVDLDELREASAELSRRLRKWGEDDYSGLCDRHGSSHSVGLFRVREVQCRECRGDFYYFNAPFVTLASRKKGERNGYFGCITCGETTLGRIGRSPIRCRACGGVIKEKMKSAFPLRTGRCPICRSSIELTPLLKRRLAWKPTLVLRLCDASEDSIHFDSPNTQDIRFAQRKRADISNTYLDAEILPGLETQALLSDGFLRWRDLYPERQVAGLLNASHTVHGLGASMEVQERLLLAVCGAAEMAGFLVRWERYHPKAVEVVANHHYTRTGVAVELDLVGDRGRGTLLRRLKATVKAAEWAQAHRVSVPDVPLLLSKKRRLGHAPQRSIIVTGSSERQLLPANTVDVAIADPPYFADVQYGELAELFYVWARASGLLPDSVTYDRTTEVVPNRIRNFHRQDFSDALARIFQETRRTLADNGKMVLMYRNSSLAAWEALGDALLRSGFIITDLAVARSENGAPDHRHRLKRSLIMECTSTKSSPHRRVAVVTPPRASEEKNLIAMGLALADRTRKRDGNSLALEYQSALDALHARRMFKVGG